MPRNYRLAGALEQLRSQFNNAYPGRDKASDGWIGDADHASRDSDHNPWVIDARGVGVVTALDIDEDLSAGISSLAPMVESIIASRDPRVKYIIYEGRMISSYPARGFKAWSWRPYTGKNAHKQHAHISVNPAPYHYDSRAEWALGLNAPAAEPVLEIPHLNGTPASPGVVTPGQTATQQPQVQPAVTAPAPVPSPTPLAGDGQLAAGGVQPNTFPAHVPQIDSARSWLGKLLTGTSAAAVLAYVGGLPVWMQVFLCSLVGVVIIGAIVLFAMYHKQIFAYVTSMNTLRATEGVGSPVISGPPPAST